jgi:hypothetical protein
MWHEDRPRDAVPPEISIGMIRRGSHYLHYRWGQPEINAFVPEL